MFSRMQLLASPREIAQRYRVELADRCRFEQSDVINAFEHLPHPIILKESSELTCQHKWGLVPPDWKAAPEALWDYTPTAKLEYISKRYSWKQVSENRCLVPATGYYEFHWNDRRGRSKTRFCIRHASGKIFSLAGLYSYWTNGRVYLRTFAVCTTSANETMQTIHNKDAAKNYHRMPVMLNPDDESSWLDPSISHLEFGYPLYKPDLIAIPDAGIQETLF
jgi:putative SOS response-associated peptidase YedK